MTTTMKCRSLWRQGIHLYTVYRRRTFAAEGGTDLCIGFIKFSFKEVWCQRKGLSDGKVKLKYLAYMPAVNLTWGVYIYCPLMMDTYHPTSKTVNK